MALTRMLLDCISSSLGYTIISNARLERLAIEHTQANTTYPIKDEYKNVQFAGAALQKLIEDHDFNSVLDIGAGAMSHAEVFLRNGKDVTAVDFGASIYYRERTPHNNSAIKTIVGDFNKTSIEDLYDCIWASHVLEHQPNAHDFLKKALSCLKEDGIIAITVPPMKHEIVGGHVSLWNAGLLLYHLVLCGVDCSEASILSYGYNISVIVRKRAIPENLNLEHDCGDIRRLRKFLPTGLRYYSNEKDDPFNGNISRLNW